MGERRLHSGINGAGKSEELAVVPDGHGRLSGLLRGASCAVDPSEPTRAQLQGDCEGGERFIRPFGVHEGLSEQLPYGENRSRAHGVFPERVLEVGGLTQAPKSSVAITIADGQPARRGLHLHVDVLAEVFEAWTADGVPELCQPLDGLAGAGKVCDAGSPQGASELKVGFGKGELRPEGPWR